jgi:hypothetical protein
MAKQNNLFHLVGRIGNQIGYRRKKQYFMREAPAVVRQTTATKKAARDFGTASSCSRIIRHALQEDLQHAYDGSLNNRLNKIFGQIVRADTLHQAGQRIPIAANMSPLLGFHFNEGIGTSQLLGCTPVIEKNDNDEISITLLEIVFRNVKALNGITHFRIKAVALSVNFAQKTTQRQESEAIMLKRREKQPPITLTLQPHVKGTTFIMLEVQPFLEMNGHLQISHSKRGYALDVIAILPPVEQLQEVKREYRNKAPRLWSIPPYPQPARQPSVILSVAFSSLPEG